MSFISFSFAIFFGVVSFLFFLIKKVGGRIKINEVTGVQFLIFGSSLVFYAFASIKFLPLILFIVLLTYFGSIFLSSHKSRIFFYIILFLDLLPLLFFKYAAGISESLFSHQLSLIFPLGLSFYTFQSIGYIADVYQEKVPCEKNFLTLAAFVTFFPCLSSGPIQRAKNLIPQLKENREFDYDFSSDGIKLFFWGMFKKLLIADQLALYVNFVYGQIDVVNGCAVLLAVILYSVQIYCDFSGYSDMAIGVARFLGFDAGKNFDHPYLSRSVGEFWRRWHISLSSWLRDYIYIPLGGSRVCVPRIYLNLLITFFVSGIWHGSTVNFLLWGLSYGVILCLERATKNLRGKIKLALHISDKSRALKIFNVVLTFIVISLLWILFRADNLESVIKIFKKFSTVPQELFLIFCSPSLGHIKKFVIKFINLKQMPTNGTLSYLFEMFVLVCVFAWISFSTRNEEGLVKIRKMPLLKRWVLYTVLIVVLILCLLLNSSQSSEFIYNQF